MDEPTDGIGDKTCTNSRLLIVATQVIISVDKPRSVVWFLSIQVSEMLIAGELNDAVNETLMDSAADDNHGLY